MPLLSLMASETGSVAFGESAILLRVAHRAGTVNKSERSQEGSKESITRV